MCRGTTAREKSKVEPEGEIGPIDNSDLIQDTIKDCDGKDFVRLKQGLNGESFEYFPVEIWTIIFGWYGILRGTIPIIRTAHNTNNDKYGLPNIQYELHPPVFTIHRLWSESSPINVAQKLKAQNPPAPITVVSRSTNYNKFLKQIKSVAGIEISQKVRVWRVPRLQPAAEPVINVLTATPPPSRPGSPVPATIETSAREPQDSWTGLLLDVAAFLQLEKGTGRELIELPDQTNNANYNGHSDLSFAGLGDSQSLVIDENIAGENFVSNYVAKDKKAAKSGRGTSTLSTSQTNSGRSSPAPSGPMTRGRTGAQKSGRTPGTVGLSNLGNTCYMNSALQCVRSVEELTKYFVTGASEAEINEDNPLGNHGNVARAYGKLLKQIYTDNAPTSVAPRDFKSVIGKYAPSFSGYGQQDSQEFLGFLLDGLQEDLSRVKKKPYIEKPDSTDEMINDPEAIREMAAKVWDISKKRDDSVIADLFTGMYKSTLVCPICSKISITFDPFNNLTLQLPIESTWQHTVFYFPMNDKPIRITVDIDKHASIRVVKEYIAKRVGTSVERLFMTEVFKSKFYRHFEDIAIASEDIGAQDNIAVFELEAKPTNWPLRKIKGKGKFSNDSEEEVPSWDDPMADRLLVPVFYRYPNNDPSPRYSLKKDRWHSGQVPHFIMLTPEEVS
jgi:ubiquitin carboxyl-terminal hydrolase 4/11/15